MDWRPLCNGHQTGIPNYSIFTQNFTFIPGHLPMDKSTVALFSITLYNGHQTSVSNYSVISTEFDIHTRTLLNYGQIVCKLVALSVDTSLYRTACQKLMPLPKFRGPSPFMSTRGGIWHGDKLGLLPAQFLNIDDEYVTMATSL
jgi:hypothetical protein